MLNVFICSCKLKFMLMKSIEVNEHYGIFCLISLSFTRFYCVTAFCLFLLNFEWMNEWMNVVLGLWDPSSAKHVKFQQHTHYIICLHLDASRNSFIFYSTSTPIMFEWFEVICSWRVVTCLQRLCIHSVSLKRHPFLSFIIQSNDDQFTQNFFQM